MRKTGVLLSLLLAGVMLQLVAQQPQPVRPPYIPPDMRPDLQGQPKPATPAQQPQGQTPQKPSPVPQTPAPGTQAAPAPGTQQPAGTTTPPEIKPSAPGGLNLQNASLTEVVDIIARQLKINYILDPRVKGGVTINTYGETKNIDQRSLLEMILRINGFGMVQVGDIFRIVPLSDIMRLPLNPEVNQKTIPEDDRTMLNLVFLKYATVEELAKLLDPFVGEGARTIAYPPANLLLIQDSRRNMRRTMELISLFDSDAFAAQRVKLFEVKEARPSDLAKELESILKSISLNEKTSPVKFMPVDRINTLIAVAPNPGVFETVEQWIKKLDVPVQITAGSIDNYVYRVKYGRAETLAQALMMLYGGYGYSGFGMGYGGGFGGGMMGGGMMGGGMYGGGYPGMMGGGMGGGYPGMMGGGMYGGGYPGMGGYGMPQGPVANVGPTMITQVPGPGGTGAGAPTGAAPNVTGDQTGTYLQGGMGAQGGRIPRIIPNPLDNTLLIQGTPQEYASIMKLLRELDIPPRQVLIDAKIYEVDLSGSWGTGVLATLQRRNTPNGALSLSTRQLQGTLSEGTVTLTAGALVGQSRELLAALAANELSTRARVISAPSVIATDSISASINVGSEVPTLSSQALTGFQSNGNSLFANNIQNRNSGVTLNILARVNPSGIVTMVINQEVSAPVPPAPGAAIQSPSFQKRTVQTQVTVQDGDTIAIGGIINETTSSSSAGFPGLHRIPILGFAFGSKARQSERTELIVFMTPRVIYDTNQIHEASDELRSRLRRLNRMIKDE